MESILWQLEGMEDLEKLAREAFEKALGELEVLEKAVCIQFQQGKWLLEAQFDQFRSFLDLKSLQLDRNPTRFV